LRKHIASGDSHRHGWLFYALCPAPRPVLRTPDDVAFGIGHFPGRTDLVGVDVEDFAFLRFRLFFSFGRPQFFPDAGNVGDDVFR
jgi:hypothetical protein